MQLFGGYENVVLEMKRLCHLNSVWLSGKSFPWWFSCL